MADRKLRSNDAVLHEVGWGWMLKVPYSTGTRTETTDRDRRLTEKRRRVQVLVRQDSEKQEAKDAKMCQLQVN